MEYTTVCDLSDCRYLVVGKEVGENQTPHLQGFIYYENPRSFKSMKKLLLRAHIEPAKGTPLQASDYCKKDGNFYEYGKLPNQGKRTDLDEVRDIVKTTGSMREVVMTAKSYQSVRMAEIMLKFYEPKRDWEPYVKWYFGSTCVGKSRQARLDFSGQDYYTTMADGKWFEGYDGQENVIIDDFREDFMPYKKLLQFLDRYEYRVETKGGSRQLRARNITITCPSHPNELFKNIDEDNKQLLRRINEIWWFKSNEVIRDTLHMKLRKDLGLAL